MTDRKAMEQALEALEVAYGVSLIEDIIPKDAPIKQAITALRTAIEQAEKQEPVACKTLCELCVKRGYTFCANAVKTTPINTPPQRKPLTGAQIDAGRRAPWGFNLDAFKAGVRFAESFHGIKGEA
jgi:hypothetical protein